MRELLRRLIPLLLLLLLACPLAFAMSALSVAVADESIATVMTHSVRVADSPPAPASMVLVRTVLPPGASSSSVAAEGVRWIAVESGEVVIPSTVSNAGFLRAADAPPSFRSPSTGSGDGQRLGVGQSILATDTVPLAMRNDGVGPAVYWEVVFGARAPVGLVRHTTMDDIVVDPLMIAAITHLPADPVEIRLERIEIDGGATLPLPASAGPRVVVIETGEAAIDLASGSASRRTDVGSASPNAAAEQVVMPGVTPGLEARSELVIQAGAIGELQNSGSDAITVLSLTVRSATNATYSPGS